MIPSKIFKMYVDPFSISYSSSMKNFFVSSKLDNHLQKICKVEILITPQEYGLNWSSNSLNLWRIQEKVWWYTAVIVIKDWLHFVLKSMVNAEIDGSKTLSEWCNDDEDFCPLKRVGQWSLFFEILLHGSELGQA